MTLRHLDEIEEVDHPSRRSRIGTWFLASGGGAAVVIASVLMAKRSSPPAEPEVDPLAELVAQQRVTGPAADEVDGRDLKFPAMLSDTAHTTTALAAVKDARGHLVPPAPLSPPGLERGPPLATDRLPVVPLPAGVLLSSTPVTTAPKDPLTELAVDSARASEDQVLAPAGAEGGFQIQVASFRSKDEADAFVHRLRQRGHSALRQAAYVAERGLWHRVRIGPFKTHYEASLYRAKLEKQERISAFVVDPEKVKRAEEVRAEKLEEQKRHGQKKQQQSGKVPPPEQ